MAQYDVDLRDYWRIIRKRKTIIIFMVFLVGICSYGFAKLKEPVPLYEATSAIKIEQSTSMADLFMGGLWTPSESLVTHAYIITSYPVLELAAKMLNMIPDNLSSTKIRNSTNYLDIIKGLQNSIKAEPQEGTNIININVVSTDPVQSKHIANTVAEAYRKHNIQEKNRKTFETKAFIEEQLRLTSKNLKKTEEALKNYKEGYELISIDSQTANLIARLYSLETDYNKAKTRLREVENELKLINRTRNSPKKLDGVFFPEDTKSALHGLSQKLHELILKRESLLYEYTEQNLEVVEVNEKIQSVIGEIKRELTTLLRTLKTRENSLYDRLIKFKKENQSIPEKVLGLERLKRDVKLQVSLYSQLKTKYQETLIKESGKVEEVHIVRPAILPSVPFNVPSKLMIVITGIIMGLFIGMVSVFVIEVFDTSIGTIEDVENLLQVPVIGVIPFLKKDEKENIHTSDPVFQKGRRHDLVTHYDPKSLSAEAFRTLRSNLQFMGLDKKGKSFLITSSFVREGKTFSSINLALSMAQAGNRVLLFETDLRKPMIHQTFGLDKTPGLTDYVLGNYLFEDIKNTITDVMLGEFELEDILRTPGLDNLNIITAGTKPPNPAEILRSSRFADLLKKVYQKYDIIFLDSPPVLPVADPTEIAPLVDGVILVYTVGKIGRGALKRAKMSLDNINAKVWGIILNNVKPEIGPDYFKYHTQYYYSPEDQKKSKSGALFTNLFSKIMKTARQIKPIKIMALIFAIFLLVLGIFWKALF